MDKLQTDKRFKCVDCGTENVSFQVFIMQQPNKKVEIDWDHDNVGNCLECRTEVGLVSVRLSHNYKDDIVAKDGMSVETNGTSNKGHLYTSYEYLVQKLGKEHFGESGDAKILCEWAFEFKDGSIGTIYNYKNGINYDPKDGFIKEHIPNWQIGGNSDRVIHHINCLLGMENHNENYKIEFNNYGFKKG